MRPHGLCRAVYIVRNQVDVLLAIHHSFVGTPPPLPRVGEPLKKRSSVVPILQGQPSLVAPMVVSAEDATIIASQHPPTELSTYIQRVLDDKVCSSVLAQSDGRVSEVVLNFVSAPSQLTALVRHMSNLAYTQVIPPHAIG